MTSNTEVRVLAPLAGGDLVHLVAEADVLAVCVAEQVRVQETSDTARRPAAEGWGCGSLRKPVAPAVVATVLAAALLGLSTVVAAYRNGV